jgi:hypothetical protein
MPRPFCPRCSLPSNTLAGCSEFNGRALARAAVLDKYDGKRASLLRDLATYAYKTVTDLQPLIERAEDGLKRWQLKEKAQPRLRLEELRLLESFLKSRPLFQRFSSVCGEHCPPRLLQCCDHAARLQVWSDAVLHALR